MKCYPCGFTCKSKDFGTITAVGSDYAGLVGRLPNNHIGSVTIYVCPKCGALHSDMRGYIEHNDRKK